jgi:hypothetical protein
MKCTYMLEGLPFIWECSEFEKVGCSDFKMTVIIPQAF